jgi:hypothetical protein
MHNATDVRFYVFLGKHPLENISLEQNTVKFTFLLYNNNKTISLKAHCTTKEQKTIFLRQ